MSANYIAVGTVCLLALLLLGYAVKQNHTMNPHAKQRYLLAILITSVIILAEIGTSYFEAGPPSFKIPTLVCNVVGFSLSPWIPVLLAQVIFNETRPLRRVLLLPQLLNMVLALLSPFSGLLFYVSPENVYMRGPAFPIYVLSYLWGLLFLAYSVTQATRKYQYKIRSQLTALLLFVLLGTSLQLLISSIHSTWLCITLALTFYYGLLCEFSDCLDALTGLFNRRTYQNELLSLANRKSAAVVIIDVDHFKSVNDSMGHVFGDHCLCVLSEMIRQAFRSVGICYRIGGDEFCVLCPSPDPQQVESALRTMLERVREYRKVEPQLPTISYGTSYYLRESGMDITQAILEADRQMYANKARRIPPDSAYKHKS